MPSAEVTIERDVLTRMAADQRFLSLLPPLKQFKDKLASTKKGCGCGRKAKPNLVQTDVENTKRQLANLIGGSVDLQRQVKLLLDTKVLRFKYMKADSSGVIVKKF